VSDPHLLAEDAASVRLDPLPLDPGDVIAGTPSAASVPLARLGEVEVGIWELTSGVARDTEVDEVFVVLSGSGSVRFADGGSVELQAGCVVRLDAGERTEWTIRQTLRKVYVAVDPTGTTRF
jgi:uncharacterized cupin superfamily protein